MIYKYQLLKDSIVPHDEFDMIEFTYPPSEDYLNFLNSMSKISLLLTTSDKCNNSTLEFDESDMDLFADLKKTFYKDCPEVQITEMLNNFYAILLEQSIVALVSSWECYFSDIITRIFNDNVFIDKLSNERDLLIKLLKKIKAFNDFQMLILLNENSKNDLNFGTYIFEN